MKKESVKNWFTKAFTRDFNLSHKNSFLYLFFSFLAIILIAEFFILNYFIKSVFRGYGNFMDIPPITILIVISILFLCYGFIVDRIKNKTKFYIITLIISIIGLFICVISHPITNFIGLMLILITIPLLIVIWLSTLVHETNILNRGRVTAMLLISCFFIGLLSLIFIVFEEYFILLCIIESILLIIIVWFSRTYEYIETEQRIESDKKYLDIIFELHFSRYSIGLAFLSGLLGGLFFDTLKHSDFYDIDIVVFSIISLFYVIAAGWFLDNVGRKTTLVIGILVVSFFYISHGSLYLTGTIFGIPKKIHISIHYALATLPLMLAVITISGDFSTERGNLKYRGSINALFMSLMCFGLAVGYLLYRLINSNPAIEDAIPNFTNLINSFVLVIILVWLMAGKDILVSKEREWAKTLKSLFVISKSGVCVYNHDFIRKFQPQEIEKEKEFDEDLISGALSGIITILSEITQSKRQIKKIDKEGNHLLFAFGRHHVVTLIATMDLPVLSKKLDDFSREFGHTFIKELRNFKGNVQRFESAKFLIHKYFKQKYADFTL